MTRGHWLPPDAAAIELMLAMKREVPVEFPADSGLIGMCTGCGYLAHVVEIPTAARRHVRVLLCENCRGDLSNALPMDAERKPARSEIALVRRKAGEA